MTLLPHSDNQQAPAAIYSKQVTGATKNENLKSSNNHLADSTIAVAAMIARGLQQLTIYFCKRNDKGPAATMVVDFSGGFGNCTAQ